MKKILIVNGPNLNLLGVREPEIYGTVTLAQIDKMCIALATSLGMKIECYQSNSEHHIIDKIHKAYKEGVTDIIINGAALGHTSVALLDALKAVNLPTYEVHLTNIYAREHFRQYSYIATMAKASIAGLKEYGYLYLISYIAKHN